MFFDELCSCNVFQANALGVVIDCLLNYNFSRLKQAHKWQVLVD